MGAHGSGSPPAEGGAAALARAGAGRPEGGGLKGIDDGDGGAVERRHGEKRRRRGRSGMCGAGGGVARGGGQRAHELRPGVRRPAVGSGESGGGRIGGAAVAGGGGEEVAVVEVLGGEEDQWRWGRASSGLGAPRDGVGWGSGSPERPNGGEAARRKAARPKTGLRLRLGGGGEAACSPPPVRN